MPETEHIKIICKNKKAHFNFEIEDTLEAGIVPCGYRSQVPTERAGKSVGFVWKVQEGRAVPGGCTHLLVQTTQPGKTTTP